MRHTWGAEDAAEAEGREHLVEVVGLKDGTYLADRLNVLVVGTHVVQGAWVAWVAVGGCEVDSDCQRDLPATAKVINEAGHFNQIEVSELDTTLT